MTSKSNSTGSSSHDGGKQTSNASSSRDGNHTSHGSTDRLKDGCSKFKDKVSSMHSPKPQVALSPEEQRKANMRAEMKQIEDQPLEDFLDSGPYGPPYDHRSRARSKQRQAVRDVILAYDIPFEEGQELHVGGSKDKDSRGN
ncbi:MAG: hypothetical protein Q9169_002138 [Polycauliona sp. 2 TL-2023]